MDVAPLKAARRRGRRVVVKIGTNTICGKDGTPDPAFLAAVADEVAALRRDGHEVVLVSSGAIGIGRRLLGIEGKVREVVLRQACASVGQARLMRAWEEAFAPHGILVAQLLLTNHTFTSRASFLNLRNATERLLALGVVPVANENDTVSVEEIDASFGDNDRLSAYVAVKSNADLLVVLSDVAGLYTRPPGRPGAELVPVVEALTPEVLRMADGRPGSGVGRGGMASKLEAARIVTRAGIPMVVASGREPRVVTRLLAGEPVGTRFLPQGREAAKLGWLEIAKPQGSIEVDAGAAAALRAGRHLLPAGVVRVEGGFPAGSVVEVREGGRAFAKALTAYSARDLDRVKGLRSDEVRRALGRAGSANVTRKDNVVLVDGRR